jgi:hypothetical protein
LKLFSVQWIIENITKERLKICSINQNISTLYSSSKVFFIVILIETRSIENLIRLKLLLCLHLFLFCSQTSKEVWVVRSERWKKDLEIKIPKTLFLLILMKKLSKNCSFLRFIQPVLVVNCPEKKSGKTVHEKLFGMNSTVKIQPGKLEKIVWRKTNREKLTINPFCYWPYSNDWSVSATLGTLHEPKTDHFIFSV